MESTVAVIVRVAPGVHWHALEDDVVVGRGYALHRPDGRVFISVDSWADDVFTALAEAMIGDLAGPVYTVVADDDREHLGRWALLGFGDNRREDEYFVPTDPQATATAWSGFPPGFSVIGADQADEDRLRKLDQQLNRDRPGHDGWVSSPAGFHRATFENRFFDPATYLVAIHAGEHSGEYAGLVRIRAMRRHAKLDLVGVRPRFRRHGLARALLLAALRPLYERGITGVTTEADESDPAAQGLLLGIGAKRTSGAIELIRRP
jgi:ribosomal protein S18 acetylase RimI-like enzyme